MRFGVSLKKKHWIEFAESLDSPLASVGENGSNFFGDAIFFCNVEVAHIFPGSHNQSTKHDKQYAKTS